MAFTSLTGPDCVRLDPATGKQTGSFSMPPFPGEKGPPTWDWVTLAGDALIGGANPGSAGRTGNVAAVSASKHLAVLDRNTGDLLLDADGPDELPPQRRLHRRRPALRHRPAVRRPARLAQAARRFADRASRASWPWTCAPARKSGSKSANVFGSWLSYSDKYDILIEAGRNARDTLSDEPKGMRAYRGKQRQRALVPGRTIPARP